ncbi:MAG: alpha/beta fold hydrolase [Verrucomicrobia bacterium]|nr:alpha/beta fold hydrolase [Verrucomicrobiota bacterium]
MDSAEYFLSPQQDDRPVLVLGHSLGTDVSLWNAVLGRLEEKFRILCFNPHPRPDGNRAGSIAGVGAELLRLLDHLGFELVDFCGLSMSGLLGQWLALEAPRRIGHLVLSNTAARIGTAEAWEERIKLIRQNGLSEIAGGLVHRWFSPTFAAQQPKVVERFINHLRLFAIEEYIAGCEAIRDAEFSVQIEQIKTRTLIIAGTQDLAATLADAEFLNRRIRYSQLLVLPCGHLACVELPQAFTDAVTRFLAQSSFH